MDSSPESTPAKRRCISMNGSRMRPLECVREFPLPRQFPSTMNQALKNGINIIDYTSIRDSANVRVLSSAENLLRFNEGCRIQDIQKLRILSPDGRDLGEFKVALRSADPLKGNTITITKSNSVTKPVTLPLSPISQRVLPRILRQGTSKIPKSNLMEAIFRSRSTSWMDNMSTLDQQQSTPLPMNGITNSQDTEGETDERACNSNINTDKILTTNRTSSTCQIVDSSNQNCKINTICNGTGDVDVRNCIKIQEITAGNSEVSSTVEKQLYKETVELPSPANCTRLATNCSDSNKIQMSGKNLKVSKGKCIATIKNTENGKIVTSLKSAANLVQGYNQIDRNLNGLDDSSRKNLGNEELSDNSLQIRSNAVFINDQAPEIKTRNIMTIIPNNKALLFNQNAALAQEYDTPATSAGIKSTTNIDHSAVTYDTKRDDTQSEGSKTGSRNSQLVVNDSHVQCPEDLPRITDTGTSVPSNVQSKDCPNDLPQQDLSNRSNIINNAMDNAKDNEPRVPSNVQNKDCLNNLLQRDLSNRLNIIKKAMDSVKDNKLRELALKALADCGIGIEKYVPKRPEVYKAVHDTQVQTIVFGLLDPKSFILINKDLEDIQRLNQITLHDMPNNQSILDSRYSNNSETTAPDVIEQDSSFDLDNFVEQFWNENSDTLKIKETLSVTKIRCNSLLEHLQRDFECAKRYNSDGMLNIHNAVISDNVHLVRRHLMILQHCRESVDILTEDGTTSLELAIKFDVCSDIVRLLLEAGAQPVIPKSVHESALIIASRQSSPYLSMLISQIKDPKLLDQIDSEGLAAIHYCSIHGNLQGVKALLSAGAIVNLRDMKSGRTPLFHAIDSGHMSMTRVLLKAGAVANIANYAGQTPLSIMADAKNLPFKVSSRKDTTT